MIHESRLTSMKANRYDHITDNELLELYYADKNQEWIGILLERYTLLLLGVCMKYLKDENEAKDGYEGWVQKNQLTQVTQEQVHSTNEYLGVHYGKVLVNHRLISLPFAIPVYEPRDLQFGNIQVNYKISEEAMWDSEQKQFNQNSLDFLTNLFLDTPYLWGGKSIFGIDCSGFVQQVFKLFGVKLLRDAYLQAEQGSLVKDLNDTKLGDLAFFQNEKGRVTHVGIILENHQIVHASGKVRIDTIDQKGIVNKETGERTHQLHSMKRYF